MTTSKPAEHGNRYGGGHYRCATYTDADDEGPPYQAEGNQQDRCVPRRQAARAGVSTSGRMILLETGSVEHTAVIRWCHSSREHEDPEHTVDRVAAPVGERR